jgi:glutamate synthase (NADPH/NADH) small chain
MMKYIGLNRHMPDKRDPAERLKDFDEIYPPFDQAAAEDQAARCEQCGVPYCQVYCPLHNNIPDWLKLTAEGRMQEAYEVASSTNNFPEICGRICPQDRLCEAKWACTLEQAGHDAVTIGAVEKHITETAFENDWVKARKPRRELDRSIGIIGAGPAGMAAAEQLRERGYSVHLYDRDDRMGGLMMYGIPNFKLDKSVVSRREALLLEAGIHFHPGRALGVNLGFDVLRAEHDALLIAIGAQRARTLELAGAEAVGAAPALDYLIAATRKLLSLPHDAALSATGRKVVVIGGGDTAMDCVRTAVRQGARSVKCLYRRNRENMPGSQREVANAEEEGVEFVWLSAPEAFDGQDQKVGAVRTARVHLGIADATGRQTPKIIEGSSYAISADMVIKALGFDPEDLPNLFDCPELEITRWGTIKVRYPSLMTNLDGVFAAGDIVRGASLVVWGIRDGRDAAASIARYITAKTASVAAVAAE